LKRHSRTEANPAVFELPGGWGLNPPPKLLSQPPNTLSNYALGSQLYTTYIQITSQF